MWTTGVCIAIAITAFLVAYIRLAFRTRRNNEPPYVAGHFLWGSGVEFSQNVVLFLHKSQKQLGDIFTFRVLNKYITIIMDPHCYEDFNKERNFDFAPMVAKVNRNIFGFTVKDSFGLITYASKTVKGKHLRSSMKIFTRNLQDSLEELMKTNDTHASNCNVEADGNTIDWSRESLRTMMSKTLFTAIFYTAFGHSADPSGEEKVKDFHPQVFDKNFQNFHKVFNYLWIGLPRRLFPKAAESYNIMCQLLNHHELLQRNEVSDFVKFSIEYMLQVGEKDEDIMGHTLVYLHVQYNTVRLAYWCVYKMVEQPRVLMDLEMELSKAIEEKREDGEETVAFTLNEINKLPLLDSFLKETLRMYGGAVMIRYCTDDTEFKMPNGQKYAVRKGNMVAMYPPTTHMDPEIFKDPEAFKHDRFVNATFYKYGKELKNPLAPFGSLCVARQMAPLQVKWFLVNLINSFSLELPEGEKTEPKTECYGHEILPPVNDVQVHFRVKEGAPVLAYSD
ncbi:hypothetical protein C0Q70_14991 [Pomacea canaliculata]|uniref:Cytochrome P450 n=1 Tax=Pomacea canaliculata TaxID=400727 RepID=A0A2T7NTK5_POMCA|nr:cholesterol 7-alpha-monooxygenase-like [Pomacea canaliculata]PVD24508.1 hypothetical protein C0Q70_14991 [Pomacea canaliculata]